VAGHPGFSAPVAEAPRAAKGTQRGELVGVLMSGAPGALSGRGGGGKGKGVRDGGLAKVPGSGRRASRRWGSPNSSCNKAKEQAESKFLGR